MIELTHAYVIESVQLFRQLCSPFSNGLCLLRIAGKYFTKIYLTENYFTNN